MKSNSLRSFVRVVIAEDLKSKDFRIDPRKRRIGLFKTIANKLKGHYAVRDMAVEDYSLEFEDRYLKKIPKEAMPEIKDFANRQFKTAVKVARGDFDRAKEELKRALHGKFDSELMKMLDLKYSPFEENTASDIVVDEYIADFQRKYLKRIPRNFVSEIEQFATRAYKQTLRISRGDIEEAKEELMRQLYAKFNEKLIRELNINTHEIDIDV